jgi:hypothetical protein
MSEVIQTRSIPYGDDRTSEEEKPSNASSLSAFASGANAALPVLLALIPLAVVSVEQRHREQAFQHLRHSPCRYSSCRAPRSWPRLSWSPLRRQRPLSS